MTHQRKGMKGMKVGRRHKGHGGSAQVGKARSRKRMGNQKIISAMKG